MNKEAEFLELRSLLFAIAYRILGSVAEAEDAVQETWLRWQETSTVPASTKAFLSTVVTRISIDVLRSARVRRESYPGQWFPEPLVTDPYQDPERAAELADSVSTAALVLLERLSPLERAAFVLHDVFGYSFAEIGQTLDRSEATCRQLAARARRHMDEGRPRFEIDRRVADELAARFFEALQAGDLDGLRELLAADAVMVADGGGKAPLWNDGVVAGDKLLRLLVGVTPSFIAAGIRLEQHEVNGAPGGIFFDARGHVLGTWSIAVLDGRIQTVTAVLNPDKLGHVGQVADPWEAADDTRRARRTLRNRDTPR